MRTLPPVTFVVDSTGTSCRCRFLWLRCDWSKQRVLY